MQLEYYVSRQSEGERLNIFLRKNGVSLAQIKKVKFLPDGIMVDGQKQNTDYLLKAGQKVTVNIYDSRPRNSVKVQYRPMDIVYLDESCMVVNKPRGMPCHPSFNHPEDTLANLFVGWRRSRGQNMPCRIINRLDKSTSGLVLLALDSYSARCLPTGTQKLYRAIVQGHPQPENGLIDLPIARKEDSIITRCVRSDGQRALTEYSLNARGDGFSLMDIKLHTGRTHQIRVHFSHLGHPLAGDGLYGGDCRFINRRALHCRQLTFTSPHSGKKICLNRPLPEDMKTCATKIHIFETF